MRRFAWLVGLLFLVALLLACGGSRPRRSHTTTRPKEVAKVEEEPKPPPKVEEKPEPKEKQKPPEKPEPKPKQPLTRGTPAPLPATITRESARDWARAENLRRARQPRPPAGTPLVLHGIGILSKNMVNCYLGDPSILGGKKGAPRIDLANGTLVTALRDPASHRWLVWVKIDSGPHAGKEGYVHNSDVYLRTEEVIDPCKAYR